MRVASEANACSGAGNLVGEVLGAGADAAWLAACWLGLTTGGTGTDGTVNAFTEGGEVGAAEDGVEGCLIGSTGAAARVVDVVVGR